MKPKIMVLTVIFVFLLNSLAESVTPSFTIEVTPRTQVMRVGQPFVFKLKYKFEQPRLSPDNGEVRKYFHHSAYLDIKDANGDFLIKGLRKSSSGTKDTHVP